MYMYTDLCISMLLEIIVFCKFICPWFEYYKSMFFINSVSKGESERVSECASARVLIQLNAHNISMTVLSLFM